MSNLFAKVFSEWTVISAAGNTSAKVLTNASKVVGGGLKGLGAVGAGLKGLGNLISPGKK